MTSTARDHDVPVGEAAPPEPPPARRPRGRVVRTTRVVVRRVDPWSVLKVSFLFYLCALVVGVIAGILLWLGATTIGAVEGIEGFVEGLGFTDFRFLPGVILRASILGGLVLVVAGTAANVLLAVLYNLINDVVGGIEVVLADEGTSRSRV